MQALRQESNWRAVHRGSAPARKSQGSTGKVKVYVNDDCVGKGVAKTVPGFSDDFNVGHARVVVCKNDVTGKGDTCKKGNWKGNPYA